MTTSNLFSSGNNFVSGTTNLETVSDAAQQAQHAHEPSYALKWRRAKLLVTPTSTIEQPYVSLLENEEGLVERLKNSPVKLVRMDRDLGENLLKQWADASRKANKSVYLQMPSTYGLPTKSKPFSWLIKRVCDWISAAAILTVLSPVMLGVALLMKIYSPGPIFFWQWRVGERGRLFRICKFRTMNVNAEKLHHQVMGDQKGLHKHQNDPRVTPLGRLMRKYSIDELPQLFNVLRGEMSLVGPRPWALYDAVRVSSVSQKRLNALPGITGAWQVAGRSTLLDLEAVNKLDLDYLHQWSLGTDFKILLRTVPKVLSGFGAC